MQAALTSAEPIRARCPDCAETVDRLRNGRLRAHKVTRGRTRGDRCPGPVTDHAIARAMTEAMTAAACAPMPPPHTLATMPRHPQAPWTADLYRSMLATPWARFVVHVLPGIDPNARAAYERAGIYHAFADRTDAERWALACACALGPQGARATTHGYITVGALDRRMKRWEALARTYSRSDACGLESPVFYLAIDPGGVVVRYTDPGHYPGYGDAPVRSMWETSW